MKVSNHSVYCCIGSVCTSMLVPFPSQNSIRHNLSLNQYFMKAPREKEGLGFGKGGYWCMHPEYKDKLSSQAYVKRKKKGIPVFPSAGLMTRHVARATVHVCSVIQTCYNVTLMIYTY